MKGRVGESSGNGRGKGERVEEGRSERELGRRKSDNERRWGGIHEEEFKEGKGDN